ncbi:unnamed protein product [Caenorhabditis angaria]|uniref:Uncharacterized protein n=1 Tax=Caenorhabditis angaria TaxID=860376 RepID=A0A9P1IG44_9PELO|nr:unnamed protein product [Caenorhabditis angaria]
MSPIKSGTSYWFWVQGGNLESAKISISLVESEQKIDFFSKFDRKKQNIVVLYCVSHCEGQNLSIKIDFGKNQFSTLLAINDSQEDNEENSTMDRTIRELQTPIGKITQAIYHRFPHSIAKMLRHQRSKLIIKKRKTGLCTKSVHSGTSHVSSGNFKLWELNFRLEDNGAVENEEAGEPKPKLQKNVVQINIGIIE